MNNNIYDAMGKKSSKHLVVIGLVIAIGVSTLMWLVLKDSTGSTGNEDANFVKAGPYEIAVSITPEIPQAGENKIRIQVRDMQGNAIENAEVRAVGEMPAMGAMPPMYAQADIKETSPGVYQGDFELPMVGAWPFAVDVASTDGQHVDLSFDLSTGRKGIRLASSTPVGDIAYHTCSMHPSVKSATPGTCPICAMDLVPVTHDEIKSGAIIIANARRQIIGVKTGHVVRETFTVPINLQGKIVHDESKLTDISLRFNGWIGELHANFEGKTIKKGEILFTVYSPELLSLQEEYLETRKRSSSKHNGSGLGTAAQKRLKLWGLSDEQIQWLEKQGKAQDYVPIFAPADGIVIKKSVVAGSAFKTGDSLLRIADLSNVWVEAFAYEQDTRLIKVGMNASIQLPNRIGENFSAEVMQIDPFLSDSSRTTRIRLSADNTAGNLMPGAFTNVSLKAELGEHLVIPYDAVMVSGDKRIVFVDQGEGRLKPTSIRVGYSDGEKVVVRQGLSENDAIVISGNFLVAAESKLKSGLDQW